MSWDLIRRPSRVGIFVAAAVVAVVTFYWAGRSGAPVASPEAVTPAAVPSPSPRVQQLQRETTRANAASTPASVEAAPTPASETDTEVATVAQYATKKYQLLLGDLRYLQASQVEQLNRALLARELLTGELDNARKANESTVRQEAAMGKVEAQIRGMLRPGDYATYELLKESDFEQFQLNEYAGGISNVAPLSDADRNSILRTKLEYKERFRQLVRDSGLLRKDMSASERQYAFSVTSRALEDYKRSYLQEVRQYLTNEEQYVLLSNFETTEFTTELDKLRSTASGG